jgi:hypothetical protein
MDFLNKYLEAGAILILVFLVVTNAKGFSQALGSVASLNTGAIRAFQGR